MRELKYELTSNTKTIGNTILYQIKALRSFNYVEAGRLGGYIEKESNLDHYDNAWVSGNAEVFGNAEVSGDARVRGNARVCGNAEVSGDARVCGNAQVSGDARVYGNAQVCGNAWVSGNAQVSGNARVYGNAWVSGNAEISNDARVSNNAVIYKTTHIFNCGPIGSRNGITTFYRAIGNKINVICGCFNGSIDVFEQSIIATHEGTKHVKTYLAAIKLAKKQVEVE